MPFARLAAQLGSLRQDNLLRRRSTLEPAHGVHVQSGGQSYTSFCSNDYLGLAQHPRIARAAAEAALRYGVGAGASHLVSGHHVLHEQLEEALAATVGLPRALYFSSGYQANIGAITSLVGRTDAVFSDALNHASLIDGARLSRAQVVRYAHADLDALDQALAASQARSRLVVTDSVFSMDGDLAPLAAMLRLCERHDAWLLVDDAHGFGVLGPAGEGVLAHLGLRSPRIVYVGTLGKAAGVSGAFVASENTVIETLIQRARTYIYTTASPPLLAAALLESLALVKEEGWRRIRLREHIEALRKASAELGVRLLASDTPIQPLVLGENAAALNAAAALRERGLLVPAIRPPTVPEGSARLRISLSAAHHEDDIARLAAALSEVLLPVASA